MDKICLLLIIVIWATVGTPSAALAAEEELCITASTPTGFTRTRVRAVVIGPNGHIAAAGVNQTLGGQPETIWGYCDQTQCQIGGKGTPVTGFEVVREWGYTIGFGTLSGPGRVYEFLPGPNGVVTSRHFSSTASITPGSCPP